GLESGDRFVQSLARVQPKEADVTVRSFSLVAALVLVPAMARSEAAAEPAAAPAAPAAAAEPADQQTPSAGPGSSSSVVIPPKLQERTDFQLSLTTLEALRKKGAITEDEYKDRKSTRLNSSHRTISYAVFCLKKKKKE